MRHTLQNSKVKFYIGDVRDKRSVDIAMKGVDYVFHAAALKQVPSCEFFPVEAVKTNVLGTENVLDSAIIGTRHGEKLYESLITREEMAKAEDMGDYFRIPCDSRDLNYDKYFVEGKEEIAAFQDYHSHNTSRLTFDEMTALLLRLDVIQEDLKNNQ